jgi:hypothetical protein
VLALVTISDDAEVAKGQILMLLEAVVSTNQLMLLEHDVPPLYSSGVRFRPEPWAAAAQSFSNVSEVLLRRWGECKSLSAWLCATYRNAAPPDQRHRYRLHVSHKDYGPGQMPRGYALQPTRAGRTRLYHVQVELPDGSIEDPTTQVQPWQI